MKPLPPAMHPAAGGPQHVAQQAAPARGARGQWAFATFVARGDHHAQNGFRRQPAAAGQRGIAHDVHAARVAVVAQQTVGAEPAAECVEHNAAARQARGRGQAMQLAAVANGRFHARAARAKRHGRLLAQQFRNDGWRME